MWAGRRPGSVVRWALRVLAARARVALGCAGAVGRGARPRRRALWDAAGSLDGTRESVRVLEAEDGAERPLKRSGQGEHIVERMDGIALECGPGRGAEPVGCGVIAHD